MLRKCNAPCAAGRGCRHALRERMSSNTLVHAFSQADSAEPAHEQGPVSTRQPPSAAPSTISSCSWSASKTRSADIRCSSFESRVWWVCCVCCPPFPCDDSDLAISLAERGELRGAGRCWLPVQARGAVGRWRRQGAARPSCSPITHGRAQSLVLILPRGRVPVPLPQILTLQ